MCKPSIAATKQANCAILAIRFFAAKASSNKNYDSGVNNRGRHCGTDLEMIRGAMNFVLKVWGAWKRHPFL
jgi:hypothetical protein